MTDDPSLAGNYPIVLAKNINAGFLFASFNLHVVVDQALPNGFLNFEPPLQLNDTII